jgi:hypothetical protein
MFSGKSEIRVVDIVNRIAKFYGGLATHVVVGFLGSGSGSGSGSGFGSGLVCGCGHS